MEHHPTPRTMSNPYRTMIAQLAAALQQQVFRDPEMDGNDLPRQARALLDQPELPELTDEELTLTYAYAVAAAVGNKRGPYTTEDAEAAQLAGLRAVLAKWGHPTPQPVPVSERLPGAEDCLDEGWAWFFNQRIGWRQAVLPVSPGYTHWLPANALPTPEALDD
jgi:hypothetical protein